jgi:predicted nucleotidyltransferase
MEQADVTVLLSGIVGSTAHGLAGPASDVDRLGVFAAPTKQLLGLHPPIESKLSIVRKDPDVTLHEAGKLCRLLLKCNPSVMELLWLPEELYEIRTPAGEELLGIRDAFLSADRVRDAFFNYARDQFTKLINGGRLGRKFSDEPPDPDEVAQTIKRRRKNARHVLRLLDQGLHLYRTGELIVRVDDPQRYFEFGDRALDDPDYVKEHLIAAELAFDRQPSVLPPRPEETAVEDWLLGIRNQFHEV